MIELSAPYPLIETTSILPNPQYGDSEALTDQVTIRRAMDGTTYSFVRRGNRRVLQMQFSLSRMKALELIAFVRSYHASKIVLKDHLDQTWIGNITPNPVELETTSRSINSPGREKVSVQLEFEGVRQ